MTHLEILFRKFYFGNFYFYCSDVSSSVSEIKFLKPRKHSFRKVEHVQPEILFRKLFLSTNQIHCLMTSDLNKHYVVFDKLYHSDALARSSAGQQATMHCWRPVV